MEEWLAIVKPSIRPSTYRLYDHAVHGWIVPRIGGRKLQEVKPVDLQRLYADLESSGRADGQGGLGARSVRLAHQVMHLSMGMAQELGLIVRSPAVAKLALPRMNAPKVEPWTDVQARRFLDATADDRLGALWRLFLSTGMRRGEALALRWSDVDLDRGWLSITRSLVVNGKEVAFSEPKTEAGRRRVLLVSDTVAALKVHQLRQELEKREAGDAWADPELVFTTTLGTALHPRNVLRDFTAACRQAGVPTIRIHDLRHTAATLALQAGAHPKLVQEMLGHARVAITLDLYSHTTPEMHREAAERLGRMLAGPPAVDERR
ncbi:MAG TPA: site-specific integrase [Acidimicrobiales bacterium]|nr:site-specific integrase [Acidimicrobiales bacterium]